MTTESNNAVTGRFAELEISGYRDVVEIGRGGFATVYRARRVAFAQDVAIKVLSGGVVDGDTVARFERERQVLGALAQHPNIVTVYDSGTTAEGAPFLAMEYLPGGTLSDHLDRQGTFDVRRVAEIAVKLSGALETAHRSGVLHRDIKPDNVMVSRYGEPVLADFGIARMSGALQTQSGVVTATLSHAPPEVLDGHPPTARSDLYSLASTLYTLLAGSAPFVRTGEHSLAPLLARVIRDPVPDLRPRGVPADVCSLLERAMAKDPADRPRSALEFGQAFQHLQRANGVPPSAIVIEELDEEVTGHLDHLDTTRLPVVAPRAASGGAPTTRAVPPPSNRAGPPTPPERTGPDRAEGRSSRRTWIAVAVAAVVAVVAAAVFLVPQLLDPDPAGGGQTEAGAPTGGPGTVTYQGAVNPAPGRADLEVADFGFTPVQNGVGEWAVTWSIRVRNPNPQTWTVGSVSMTVTFTDDRGVVLNQGEDVSIYPVPPGATNAASSYGLAYGSADTYTVRPARMNITVTSVNWEDDAAPEAVTFGSAELQPPDDDSLGRSYRVSCEATSTLAEEVQPTVVVLLRDDEGRIVGGESTSQRYDGSKTSGYPYTSIVLPPGSTTPLELQLDAAPEEATSAECFASYYT
ncbi:serine/threonine-protein kinase [Pseudonocardia humida]|uniref:non-specific serine/threonine protein kinase n=1 Tax=Pseudonocardia humida TaxID=2800819 RepID=A0ABT0ZW37_9PSEU|nr:serine/threonine-protein kinase [Pseudonocardia humida]MCO1654926.1 serine/threonine protein kinase [Pseudonocardia humida]